jgi:hypothetical protein
MKKIQSDSISGNEVAVEINILSKLKAGEMKISVSQNVYHYHQMLKMFTVMNNPLK